MSSRNWSPRSNGSRRQRRSVPPLMEGLEVRMVLSTLTTAALAELKAVPPFEVREIIGPNGTLIPDQTAGPTGLSPQQLQDAYGINSIMFGSVQGTGAGQTIALIDAFNNPSFVDSGAAGYATSALPEFDKQFGLPDPPSFTIYNQTGQTTNLPGPDVVGGWGVEEALDIEWAHAMAPDAKIDVVLATSPVGPGLYIAAKTAATTLNASVVSMSFGANFEAGGFGYYEQDLDATYFAPALAANPNVTFLASTGDDGADESKFPANNQLAAPEYPSISPLVVAVGGTTLTLGGGPGTFTWVGETGWSYNSPGNFATSASGGGISNTYPAPAYQSANGINLGNGFRTVPDVSSDANPTSGVSVYDPYDFGGSATPWDVIGGTSLASPTWAGMIAIADQGRSVLYNEAPLNGPDQTLPALYALGGTGDSPSNYSTYFHDITTGFNFYNAGPGYDLVTGIGSPQANNLLPALAGFDVASTPAITIQPPKTVIQGGFFGTALEAQTAAGALATSFEGTATISLTSGPAGATLAGTTTVSFDNGVAVFDDLTLSAVSATPYDFQIVVSTGTTTLATVVPNSVVVDQAATPNVGAYYPVPLDSCLRADVASVDGDSNKNDDVYLVYQDAYELSGGQLLLENTSSLASKSIQFISDDEYGTTAPIINANQSSRVFEIIGTNGTSTNLSVLFSGMTPQGVIQGIVIEGGLATDDGGLSLNGSPAAGGALLIDGGSVALSNIMVKNNEARGTTGAQGSVGASRSAGTGGPGRAGGKSEGGAIYIAAGSLTLNDDPITGNIARGGAGGSGGSGGIGGTFATTFQGGTGVFENPESGGVGGTGGAGGTGAGGALYVAGGNVSITSGSLAGNQAVGGSGGNGGSGGQAFFPGFRGGAGGKGGLAGVGSGGAIYLGGGALTLVGSAQIDGNKAAGGVGGHGGAGAEGGECSFSAVFGPGGDGGAGGKGSDGFGGGMYVLSGTVTWSAGSSLDGNAAVGGNGGAGGAAPFTGGTPGSNAGNTAAGFGGGLFDQGTLTLTGADIESNTATNGGGIDIHGTLTLIDSTLTGNTAASDGGAVFSSGSLTVTDGTITGNAASTNGGPAGLGGGIYASANVNVTGTVFSDNNANGSGGLGGAIFSPKKTTLTVTDVTFESNTAVTAGGGIASEGTLVVSGSTFTGNQATGASSEGGAIYNDLGTATVSGSTTFQQNSAAIGGAISSVNSTGQTLTITGALFTDNTATSFGGAIDSDGTLTLSGDSLTSNNAENGGGGAIFDQGSLTVNDGTVISNNIAPLGGGIYNKGSLSLSNVTVSNNLARATGGGSAASGGGIYDASGAVAVTGGSITGNTAATAGGGVFVNTGALTITALAVIEDNSAELGGGIDNAGGTLSLTNVFILSNTASDGAGVANSGNMTIAIVTFSGDSAGVAGGGIYNTGSGTVTDVTFGSDASLGLPGDSAGSQGGGIFNSGTLTFTNSTIAADSASVGGGIYNSASTTPALPGTLTTLNVTIAENSGGGGLYLNSGTATLYNTIVALNTSGGTADDISTAPGVTVAADSSFDLTGTGGSGGLSAANNNQLDIGTANLDLGALADNGGPTETVALLTGSDAIDKGSNSIAGVTVPTSDQARGPAGPDRTECRTYRRHWGLRSELFLPGYKHSRLIGVRHLAVSGRVGQQELQRQSGQPRSQQCTEYDLLRYGEPLRHAADHRPHAGNARLYQYGCGRGDRWRRGQRSHDQRRKRLRRAIDCERSDGLRQRSDNLAGLGNRRWWHFQRRQPDGQGRDHHPGQRGRGRRRHLQRWR